MTGRAKPNIQRELADGLYVDRSFSVPKNGANPDDPDLVSGYRSSVRELIRERLSSR